MIEALELTFLRRRSEGETEGSHDLYIMGTYLVVVARALWECLPVRS